MNELDDTAMENLLARARRGWSPNAGDAERVRRGLGAALARGAAAPAMPAPGRGTHPWLGRVLVTAAFTAAGAAGGYWAGRGASGERPASSAQIPAAAAATPSRAAAGPTPVPPAAPALAPPASAPAAHPVERPRRLSVAAPANRTPAESLAVEVRALRNAERALRDRNPGLASAFLDDLDRAIPGGQMREERAALRAIARCTAGQQPFGVNLADEFSASYSSSAYRARVEQACGTDSAGGGDSAGRR